MSQGFVQPIPLPLPINNGGTGAVTAPLALANLGLIATAANLNLLTSASQTVVQHVYFQTGVSSIGQTAIPYDDTIPQITEGVQFMSLAITPKNSSNILKIECEFVGGSSIAGDIITLALFQDSIANALAATPLYMKDGDLPSTAVLVFYMVAGTTSSTTFRIRAGITSGSPAAITFNGAATVRKYGGVAASSLRITELTP